MSKFIPTLVTLSLLAVLAMFGVPAVSQVKAKPPLAPPTPVHHHHGHEASVPEDAEPITLSGVATNTSIADLLARVDGDRWHADVTTLAQFGATPENTWGTRHTGTAGNLAARDWISSTLASLGWASSFHQFTGSNAVSYNVIAERRGELYPDNVYIVDAHFDSISFDSNSSILAPGAEDNASGTAALLEIARVLQDQAPASTIRLIAFSGEEQGLYGSRAYVSDLKSAGELDNVQGVYNLDMIGFTSDADLDVRLESYSPSTTPWMGDFRDHLASMAATYTPLQIVLDNGPCCSDHKPFLDEEVPAVLLIEDEYYDYFNALGLGHSSDDLPKRVVPAQGAAVIHAVLAALAEKAGIVCMLADVNCDGGVTLADLTALAGKWGSSLGQDGFEGKYDLNDDDTINIIDLQLAADALTGN